MRMGFRRRERTLVGRRPVGWIPRCARSFAIHAIAANGPSESASGARFRERAGGVPRARINDPLERLDRPDLALVSDELWHAVQARFEPRRLAPGTTRHKVYLLSGLLRCGVCCGNMTCVGGEVRRYGCTAAHKRGRTACRNRATVPIRDLEHAVLGEAKVRLKDRLPEIREMFAEELRAYTASAPNNRRGLEQQAAEAEKQVRNLINAIANGGPASLLAKLQETEARRDRLKAELASTATVTPPALPSAAEMAKSIAALDALSPLDPNVGRERFRGMLADGAITCTPIAEGYSLAWAIVPNVLFAHVQTPPRVSSGGRVYEAGCGGPKPVVSKYRAAC
jgi:hypothetical protein